MDRISATAIRLKVLDIIAVKASQMPVFITSKTFTNGIARGYLTMSHTAAKVVI